MSAEPIRIGVVAGEESGDQLAADLLAALTLKAGRPVELTGVGGAHLRALGLQTQFDPADIALMGITAVLRDLPRLVRRLGQTAQAIVAAKPDCLITVDSPDFSLRVAKRVRALNPAIPIVHYVSPSVWAWRPGRAKAMAGHVDHVLCLLPFEPAELKRLGGPAATFVGHRLSADAGLLGAAQQQAAREPALEAEVKTLLVLPGSRGGEISSLLPLFGETVAELAERGNRVRIVMPTLPRHEAKLRDLTSDWPVRPSVVTGVEAKWEALASANAALAASGTVTLELALAGVPLVAAYKVDPLVGFIARRSFRTWTASLPNLIADWPVVPEHFNEFVRPGMLARQLERLMKNGLARAAQIEGFARVSEALRTDRPAGEIAADVVLDLIRPKTG